MIIRNDEQFTEFNGSKSLQIFRIILLQDAERVPIYLTPNTESK